MPKTLPRRIDKGLAWLFPNARPSIDYDIILENGATRIAAWRLPDPQPSDPAIDAAIVAYDADQAQRQQQATQLRQNVIVFAQSVEGVAFTDLTPDQLRRMLGVLMWRAGMLDNTGHVRLGGLG